MTSPCEIPSRPSKAPVDSKPPLDEKSKMRRAQIAEASRQLRRRRKKELEELKMENRKLKEERKGFQDEVEQLRKEVTEGLKGKNVDKEDFEENQRLKEQLRAQQKMLNYFVKLVGGYPSEESAKRKLYNEGAENAVDYLLSLLSQSQDSWLPATFDPSKTPVYAVYYKRADSLFGVPDAVSRTTSKRERLNLRIDLLLPPFVSAETFADGIKAMISDFSASRRIGVIGKSDNVKLEVDHESSAKLEGDTHISHYKHEEKQLEASLVVTKQRRRMPKSSLESKGKRKSDQSLFGDVDTWCVVSASTSLRSVMPRELCEQNRIQSLILSGGIIWENVLEEQGKKELRLNYIISFPPDFIMYEHFNGEENIIDENGATTEEFDAWTSAMLSEFSNMVLAAQQEKLSKLNINAGSA